MSEPAATVIDWVIMLVTLSFFGYAAISIGCDVVAAVRKVASWFAVKK